MERGFSCLRLDVRAPIRAILAVIRPSMKEGLVELRRYKENRSLLVILYARLA
jgi:hypothetical protein